MLHTNSCVLRISNVFNGFALTAHYHHSIIHRNTPVQFRIKRTNERKKEYRQPKTLTAKETVSSKHFYQHIDNIKQRNVFIHSTKNAACFTLSLSFSNLSNLINAGMSRAILTSKAQKIYITKTNPKPRNQNKIKSNTTTKN